MARLFSLLDATAQDDPEFGHFEAGPDGAFAFPDELSARLHRVHHNGQQAWETQGERVRRLHGEDLARRRDPAALHDMFAEFTAAMKSAGQGNGVSPDIVTAMAAQIEALTAKLAEMEAKAAAPAGDGEQEVAGAAKTARSRSKSTPPAET